MQKLAGIGLALMLIPAGWSQTESSTSDSMGIDRIDPVIITGDAGARKTSDLPFNAYVISNKTIKEMAAQNLGDVLKYQSNILQSQDPVLGAGISMQGLGGQSVKILIDGIPMIGRLNGNIDIGQLLVSQVDRIEIIEGPMSVMYGSDAVGGVVNIITKSPKHSQFQLNSFQDVVSNTNADASITLAKGKNTVGINFGRQYFGGIDFDTTTKQRQNPSPNQTKLFHRAAVRPFQCGIQSGFNLRIQQSFFYQSSRFFAPYLHQIGIKKQRRRRFTFAAIF